MPNNTITSDKAQNSSSFEGLFAAKYQLGNAIQIDESLIDENSFDEYSDVETENYTIHFGEQGTAKWFQYRMGRITGSKVADLVTPSKMVLSESKTAKVYLFKVQYERENGISAQHIFDSFESWQMKEGKENEPIAAKSFAGKTTGWECVSFVSKKDSIFGISPDRVRIENNRIVSGLEIKCPQSENGYFELLMCKNSEDLRQNKFDYWLQCQLCMYVCDLEKWHFYSFVNNEKAQNHYILVEKSERAFNLFKEIEAKFI